MPKLTGALAIPRLEKGCCAGWREAVDSELNGAFARLVRHRAAATPLCPGEYLAIAVQLPTILPLFPVLPVPGIADGQSKKTVESQRLPR